MTRCSYGHSMGEVAAAYVAVLSIKRRLQDYCAEYVLQRTSGQGYAAVDYRLSRRVCYPWVSDRSLLRSATVQTRRSYLGSSSSCGHRPIWSSVECLAPDSMSRLASHVLRWDPSSMMCLLFWPSTPGPSAILCINSDRKHCKGEDLNAPLVQTCGHQLF